MDIEEIAEKITEREEEEEKEDKVRKRVALYISLLAMLLAVTALGGNNATKEYMGSNISASDTYAFYQAKTIRQTIYSLTAEELGSLLATQPGLSEQSKAEIQARIDRMRATAARYESEPENGDGKKELLAKAKGFEQSRDIAAQRDPYFDYAEALLQIAIVLASISLVTGAAGILWLSYGIAVVGTFLMVNAYTLLVHIPFL